MHRRGARFGLAVAAAIAAVALHAPTAQAYYCTEPSEPWVPTPAWATQETMAKADADIEAYLNAVNDYITCLQDAITAVDAKRKNVLDQWTWTINNLPQQ
jgi:hypothetical protein